MQLQPLPDSFAASLKALHRVAEEVVAPARKPHNEIALRQTPGGFGTPPFEFGGRALQVRVEEAEIVLEADGEASRAPLTSVAEAAAHCGEELFPEGLPDDRSPLGIDAAAAQRLADFYAFSAAALEAHREALPEDAAVSELNLWPEHFDIAFEAGSEEAEVRANYGASPGDEHHPDPYLYVGPWTARPEGELWNGTGFTGAELGYSQLLQATDPSAAAAEFFQSRTAALNALA